MISTGYLTDLVARQIRKWWIGRDDRRPPSHATAKAEVHPLNVSIQFLVDKKLISVKNSSFQGSCKNANCKLEVRIHDAYTVCNMHFGWRSAVLASYKIIATNHCARDGHMHTVCSATIASSFDC